MDVKDFREDDKKTLLKIDYDVTLDFGKAPSSKSMTLAKFTEIIDAIRKVYPTV